MLHRYTYGSYCQESFEKIFVEIYLGNVSSDGHPEKTALTVRNHPHIFRLNLLFFQNADSIGIIITITAIITLLLIWRILFYDGESTRTVSLREHNSGNFFLYEIRTNIDRHRKTI